MKGCSKSRTHQSRTLALVLMLICLSNPLPAQDVGPARQVRAPQEFKVPEADYRFGEPSEVWRLELETRRARYTFAPDESQPEEYIPPIDSFFFPFPETVCDPDERAAVMNTAEPPWNANCLLIITFKDGRKARGTGWLLGPKLVVTAGHCVHEGKDGNFYNSIEVIPGANGGSTPFGTQVSMKLRASEAWKTQGTLAMDYGAIILSQPFVKDGKSPSTHAIQVKG